MGRRDARSAADATARERRPARPGARGGAHPGSSVGVRSVPDRPASRGGRPRPAPTANGARPRSRRDGGRRRPGCPPVPARAARRDRVAPRHLRGVPMVPSRAGEPLPGRPVHGLGRRRWVRGVGGRARGLRVRAPRPLRRRARRAPVVRRDHRIPRPEACLVAARRSARDLRVRGVGPPGGAGRARAGCDGPRPHTRAGGARAGPRHRGPLGGPG